ncbi:oxysterol binding protein-like protein [Aureobasidium sp. EXF-12298]|nr:oxysterol binding protein-like protein [Aureobasidium sp. EXF-12298]KAI4766783.1 oxysterol binding protein-like protein [Aureobasidium sp. EXF-12344]KAI4784366.1 oxysterol binding protein-like protein [Aureobasidium sp. EXF-3400]
MAEGSAVPTASKGSWGSFLKSIASFNGDLSSLTAPAFILSTTSLTEFSAYWAEMPSVLVAPASEADKQKRCMLVLKWFLSTLKQQYTSRNEKLGSEKKPLNPFLGELFLGKWVDQAGTTELVSEQVSHHPPVTAYSIWNKQHGVRLQGYNAQKASFGRTINVKQIGHAVLHIDQYDEDYLITLPALHIEGLITGSPYVELEKSTHIVSSTGYTCKIDYSGKGWVSGKKNSFTATMYPNGREKDVIYNAEGQWSGNFVIKDTHKKVVESYDASKMQKTPLTVAPIEQQDPLESRRAWYKVAEAINRGDMDTTSSEKSLIENNQRELRKREKETNSEWQRRFFNRVPNSPRFDAMIHQVPGGSLEADKTNGVWEFDPARAKAANPNYQI